MNRIETAPVVPVELLRKYDRPGPRYTSYPTAPMWSGDTGAEHYRQALTAASRKSEYPLALYVHIPFCRCRCYYCGCNTVVTKDTGRVGRYVELLLKEIGATAEALGERRTVSQLHFGGGTPTFLDIPGLKLIIDYLREHFRIGTDAELSIEVDPRVTTSEQLDFLRQQGFNRLSIGVQDFDPEVQEAIGRVQPETLVVNILEHGRRLGFRGINFDLIYGLPRQTVASFTRTIEKTIALRPDRLAVYSFAFLPGVKSHQLQINKEELPDTETKYGLFAAAVNLFNEAGYNQIGMDHFALPEDELSLAQRRGMLHRNFMGYTVKTAPDMVAFGMSSIGYINDAFYQNHSKIDSYMESIETEGFATYRGMQLTRDDLIRQYVITNLMCNFTLNFDALLERHGVDYHRYFETEHEQLGPFVADGLLEISPAGLRVTPLGRTFVRNIAMTFDAYLDTDRPGEKPTFSRTI